MIHDFRFAFRQLIKAPGFTFAAVLVLGLGIGANTAVFSLVNTLFFAPPAYTKPHEMLQIFSQDRKDPKKFRGFSYPTYRDIREQNTVFNDVMAFNLDLWLVRAGAAMFSVFGGLALALAVVGLCGVKAYSIARRTREIGIRMALGAHRGMVLRLIMCEGSVMLLCGLVLGLLLAAATGKILSGILFEVGAFDPPAFASAFIVLAAATLLATWLPARRATRINPMIALRVE